MLMAFLSVVPERVGQTSDRPFCGVIEIDGEALIHGVVVLWVHVLERVHKPWVDGCLAVEVVETEDYVLAGEVVALWVQELVETG